MTIPFIRCALLAGLVVALAQPAMAQTARIAHFSHGGSLETLDATATLDNFGTPPYFPRVDSVHVDAEDEVTEYGVLVPTSTARQPEKYENNCRWVKEYTAENYLFSHKLTHPNFKVGGILVDSVRVVSATQVEEYAHRQGPNGKPVGKGFWYAPGASLQHGIPAKAYAIKTKREHPEAVVLGYTIPADSLLPAGRRAEAKPLKVRRKKSTLLPVVPAPPAHPGVGWAVAAILMFAGAGWLLGERRVRPQTELAA